MRRTFFLIIVNKLQAFFPKKINITFFTGYYSYHPTTQLWVFFYTLRVLYPGPSVGCPRIPIGGYFLGLGAEVAYTPLTAQDGLWEYGLVEKVFASLFSLPR